MVNINGNIVKSSNANLFIENRGFTYGDSIFETIKVNNKPLFWESHYFRLMSSMRILRMEIPMSFTPEFLENEIMTLIRSLNSKSRSYRVKFYVYRKYGGFYTPKSSKIEYMISATNLEHDLYYSDDSEYEIELFKDYLIAPNLLSSLKTNNKVLNVVGSIFAKENNYENCLLLNTNKNVIEALNGNVFLVKDKIIKTPPISDGCLKGVLRNEIIKIINQSENYDIDESSISPFELQKADEIFITNVIQGINSVTKYRKKIYTSNLSKELIKKLNLILRIS
tara:strand:- start:1590 stop:2432 length:843 start_codon:yes stop_codon:yes gene_type:complete